jgi:hypothetical protein
MTKGQKKKSKGTVSVTNTKPNRHNIVYDDSKSKEETLMTTILRYLVHFILPLMLSLVLYKFHYIYLMEDDVTPTKLRKEDDCNFVLAENEDGSFGVFTLRNLRMGESVLPSDLAIPLLDLRTHQQEGLESLLKLSWSYKVADGVS